MTLSSVVVEGPISEPGPSDSNFDSAGNDVSEHRARLTAATFLTGAGSAASAAVTSLASFYSEVIVVPLRDAETAVSGALALVQSEWVTPVVRFLSPVFDDVSETFAKLPFTPLSFSKDPICNLFSTVDSFPIPKGVLMATGGTFVFTKSSDMVNETLDLGQVVTGESLFPSNSSREGLRLVSSDERVIDTPHETEGDNTVFASGSTMSTAQRSLGKNGIPLQGGAAMIYGFLCAEEGSEAPSDPATRSEFGLWSLAAAAASQPPVFSAIRLLASLARLFHKVGVYEVNATTDSNFHRDGRQDRSNGGGENQERFAELAEEEEGEDDSHPYNSDGPVASVMS